MTKNLFGMVAAFAVLLSASIPLGGCGNGSPGTPILANTTSGPVQGFVEGDSKTRFFGTKPFLGIAQL
jgi:hypothetical protein